MDWLVVWAAGQLAAVVVMMAYFIGVQHGQQSMRPSYPTHPLNTNKENAE